MKKEFKNRGKGTCFRIFKNRLLKNPLISPTELAIQIYDCKDEKIAATIASQNLKKLNITFPELMNRHPELSDVDDLQDLARLSHAKKLQDCDIFVKGDDGKLRINKNSNDFIEVDDNPVQAKVLELRLKLKGHLRTDAIQINGDKQIILVRSGSGEQAKIDKI